ncbi:BQ5605_C023g09683 [Microbotryum silenes-dioicae]|uniref:COP9 signalosome complex subunit 3 n=1 Tax=Microbotryum silenes-dioicae TaxID=796604 RepID=A0A2X0MLD0_9BASI|nr:BQ5605_C023g09683 [Microbotryum silenes-dioicae]
MDSIVELIKSTSTFEQLHKEVQQLRKLDKASNDNHTSIFESALQDGRDPLEVLDSLQHSAGYLFILNARLSVEGCDLDRMLPLLLEFSEKFDYEQLALVPDQVSYLVKTITNFVQSSPSHQATIALLLPLRLMVMRSSRPGHLTVLHPGFLDLCIKSRAYDFALDLLLTDTIDVDNTLGQVKYMDHLQYHYLGGAVSAPGHSVSLVQIDAYKKLVILQLLTHGKTSPLPKYTAPNVHGAIKSRCAAYLDFATAYMKLDKSALMNLVAQHGPTFEEDLNSGLVKRCLASLRRRQIEKLTETYMTLSLGDLCQALGLDRNVEHDLLDVKQELSMMIDEKHIFGSITPADDLASATVTFTDDSSLYTSHETLQRLAQSIATTQKMIAQSDARAKEIEKSKEFVTKAYAAAGNQASAMAGGHGMNLALMPSFGGEFDYAEEGVWDGGDD